MDAKGFSGISGFFRILTIMIGIVDFGFTLDGYLHHFSSEEFFLGVVITNLILSIIIGILIFIGWDKIHKIDIIFHIIGSFLLFIGGCLMLNSVFKFGKTYSKFYYGERISSGILGILNSFIYGILSWLIMRKS